MISEVANSVFLTYLATEYSLWTANNNKSNNGPRAGSSSFADALDQQQEDGKRQAHAQQKRVITVALVVLGVNGVDRITGMGTTLAHSLAVAVGHHQFWHIPKIVLAAGTYVASLYYDCRAAVRRSHSHNHSDSRFSFRRDFAPRVVKAFGRILPIYPILAVLISFGFLFVINVFELLHLSTDILNWPIYYGTLYGPFSYIYYTVKGNVIQEHQNKIPLSTHPPRRLGSV